MTGCGEGMAKIKKYETKDGERIDLTVTDAELLEAAKKTAQDKSKETEAWHRAIKLAGGAAPTLYVEPIDEHKSRCYVIGKDGKKIDLGELPTLEGLRGKGKIQLSDIEKELKEREAQEAEISKKLAESLSAIDLSRIGGAFKKMADSITATASPGYEAMKDWAGFSDKIMESFTNNVQGYFKQVSDMMNAIKEALDKNPVFSLYADEIEKLSHDPEYKDADVYRPGLDYEDEAETILAETLHNKALLLALENARLAAAQKEQETQDKQDTEEKPLLRIHHKDSPTTIFPIDKIDRNIWKMIEGAQADGQMRFQFLTGDITKKRRKNKVEPLVYYSLDFNAIEKAAPETASIVKHLTSFDKRVMVAVAALFNAGNYDITVSDIYHKIGNSKDKKPNMNDTEKIYNSLKKQKYANIRINNAKEIEAGYDYPRFFFEGSIIDYELCGVEKNGRIIDAAIHVYREPPLITFAKGRNQITTVKNEVLESPVNKTEQNLQIDDYLIERIAFMKRDPKTSRKILYKSLFDDCGITRNQSRAKETIERYLKHYKATEYIKGYKMEQDSVTITP